MFKLFKNLTKKDIFIIFIAILIIIFQVWLDLRIPEYMSKITTLIQTEGSTINDILKQGGFMLLCAGASLIAAIITGYMTAYVSSSLSMNVRDKVYSKVEDFSLEEVKEFSTGSLITRTTSDVGWIEIIISMGLQLLIKAPITAIWAIMKILNKGWEWSLLTGGAVLILLIMIGVLFILVMPKFKIMQKLTDNINNLVREHLTGIRVVRAFNAEKYQEKKFDKANKKLTNTQLYTSTIMSIFSPSLSFLMNCLPLLIYFVGAFLINNATLSMKITLFSNMVVFSSYAMQVIMSFLMVSFIFILYPRASVSAKRIIEVLNKESKIKDGTFDGFTNEIGTIEFKNVSFKYPDADKNILTNISFKIEKGDTFAFIGSTGSGKSTIINLILRFYDVTKGEILVDGINVKDYKLDTLYKKIGYVPQKAIMFTGSVKDNVGYGNELLSDKEIETAIEVAQAREFVSKMDKRLDSHIARGGTNISGGQKQRLSIARAIAKNPEIYMFDDSFSALDYKTDFNLRKELKKFTKDATNIIVTTRIGTIKNANKILVLDKGHEVGLGTHKELLKTCKVYQEIAYSQLTKEELENG